MMGKVTKHMKTATKTRECRLTKGALTRQRGVEMKLLNYRERTLDRILASKKLDLASANVKNQAD